MKKRQILLATIFGLSVQLAGAQATTANIANTVTATDFLGSSNNFDVLFKRNTISAGLLATNKTFFGLNAAAMPSSVSFGVNAGQFSSGTGFCTYIGQEAGRGGSASVLNSGAFNTFNGYQTGFSNSTGEYNTFFGFRSGYYNTTGSNNIFVGSKSGQNNRVGTGNVYIGNDTGGSNYTGSNNVFIGTGVAGLITAGSNNVFIGTNAGASQTADSNKLFIANSNTTTPLIWGDFAASQLKFNGAVSINTALTPSGYQLGVGGKIIAEELKIQLQSAPWSWPDYVFAKDYKLPTLLEVEQQIKDKGHLAGVPSAQEVKENGIEVGNMAKIQQEKIEELTLYIIELNKKLEAQAKKMEVLEAKINNK